MSSGMWVRGGEVEFLAGDEDLGDDTPCSVL